MVFDYMQYQQKLKSWINERKWINPYWLKISEHPGRIFLEQDLDLESFKHFIADYQSIICEFGSGSGEHLVELARRNIGVAVIGFELRFKRIVKTIEKAKKAKLDNAFVICGYAQNAKQVIAPDSVSRVFINFPDPWEKNIKHRLINADFLSQLDLILTKTGIVSFKTDHQEYFQSVRQQVEDTAEFKVLLSTEDMYRDLPREQIIPTEFEKLFLSQHLPIYALSFSKR